MLSDKAQLLKATTVAARAHQHPGELRPVLCDLRAAVDPSDRGFVGRAEPRRTFASPPRNVGPTDEVDRRIRKSFLNRHQPVAVDLFVVVDHRDEFRVRGGNAGIQRVRAPGLRLVQIFEAAVESRHERRDNTPGVVSRAVVDDGDCEIGCSRPIGGEQALERTREQVGSIIGGDQDI